MARRDFAAFALGASIAAACSSFSGPPDETPDASTPPPPPGSPPPNDGGVTDAPSEDAAKDATTSAYRDLVLADGPLAYWRMNILSGTKIPDESNNKNDLPLAGGSPTFGVPGALAGDPDTALAFDGVAYAALDPATSRAFDFGALEPFTFEVWAKRAPVVTTTQFHHLFGDIEGTSPDRAGYIFYYDDGLQKIVFQYDWLVAATGHGITVSSGTSPTNRFAYYAVVFDGATLELYVDGIAAESTVGASAMGARTSTKFMVAFEEADATHGFIGALDEMAIYAKALDATKINAHYTLGVRGK
jgi:hypothetical protein